MLTVIELKNRKEKYYDYEYIYECIDDNERNSLLKDLYDRSKNKEIELYCTCIKNKEIPLVVSKHNDTYYIKRKNALEEHSPDCKFDGDYLKNLKGWDLRANGNVYVSLKDRIYRKNAHKNPRIMEELTFEQFTRNWMNISWEGINRYFSLKNKYPLQLGDFFTSLNYWADKIKFEERVCVSDLISVSSKKIANLNDNELRGICLLMYDSKEKYDSKNYLLSLIDPTTGEIVNVLCSTKLWNDKYKKLSYTKTNLMVGCLLESDKDNLICFDISIIPVSQEGAIVNNEYDKKLINDLHKKNRLFVQSFNYYGEFKYHKPSLILVDSVPNTIVEIFDDDRSNSKYYNNKQIKLSYFTNLGTYKVIIWDGYNKDKLFKFEKRR